MSYIRATSNPERLYIWHDISKRVVISVPAKFKAALDKMKDDAGMTRSDFVKQCVLEAGPQLVQKSQRVSGEGR